MREKYCLFVEIVRLIRQANMAFIIFGEEHLHHETQDFVQTLGGDQSKHAIDPGPNSYQCDQVDVHTDCKSMAHEQHQLE